MWAGGLNHSFSGSLHAAQTIKGSNMLKVNRLLLTGLAATVLAYGPSAKADTITQQWDFVAGSTQTFNETYNLFNSNLGTLTNVRFRLVSDTNAEVQIANSNAFGTSYSDANSTTTVLVQGPPSAFTYVNQVLATASHSGFIGASSLVTFSGELDHQDSTTAVGGGSFYAYQQAGGGTAGDSIDVTVQNPHSEGTGGSGVFFGGSATTSGRLYLYYDFTSTTTPEPGTWALVIASASVSVAGIRRRRVARK